jgi:hypothetical protein
MSDQLTGGLFESGTFMSPPWWLGRVESKETWQDNIEAQTFTNIAGIEGWGYRYKVRVFNWHTGDLATLPPDQMAFCQVIMPVTAGSGHGGASVTPSIESGSVVFGFFMDGMAGQEGYIVGVLGNSNNNVPKVRGAAAPNQTAVAPSLSGPILSNPPAPSIGPGSLANLPLPPNVDQLSSDQLKKLLNPARTPSREEFSAASKARSEAKLKGLPLPEIERQVLIATVKASRLPGASSPVPFLCNQGYQQFNDTFSDSNKAPAYVPDNLNVYNIPLQITEGLHLKTLAWDIQDQDKRVQRPLRNACKKVDSDVQGIAKVLNNLIKDSNNIAKIAGEVSVAASSIQSQTSSLIQTAAQFASSYMINILTRVLEELQILITEELQKRVIPNLFPSEIPTYNNIVSEALEILSCLFRNIMQALVPTFVKLLTDLLANLVSGPICAVQQLISDFLNPILGQISSALSSVLGTIGNIAGLVASAFSLLSGILNFFKCDEQQQCPGYDQIDLAGPAKPAIAIGNFSSGILNSLNQANRGGTTGSGSRINCNVEPVFCGPPKVNFFGGNGSGGQANPIVSNSSSIIGFDIVNPGSYTSAPIVTLEDPCGNGSGGAFEAIMEPDENNPGKLKIKNILVKSPGTGYLQKPNGSMGGDGFVWKEPDEGYIRSCNGEFKVVRINKPVELNPGETYYPPNGKPETLSVKYTKYKVNIPQNVSSKNCPAKITITNTQGRSRKYYGFINNDTLSLNTIPNNIVKGGSSVEGLNIAEGTIIVLDINQTGIGTTAAAGIGTTTTAGIGTTTPGGPGIGTTTGSGTTIPNENLSDPESEDTRIIELPLLPVNPINIPVVDDFAIVNQNAQNDQTIQDQERLCYKAVLCVEEIQVIQTGFAYRPEDEIVITPSNGMVVKPIINEFGQITEVKVLSGGCGFDDIPEIKTNSPTGFNALLVPIITVKRICENGEFDVPKDSKVINVVDCTGCIKCRR